MQNQHKLEIENIQQQNQTPRRKSQNFLQCLRDRESGFARNLPTFSRQPPLYYERKFYKYITPNLTIQNVDCPMGYLRKFTPDGRMLLSFSQDQRTLLVWNYLGAGQAAKLLQHEQRECISSADTDVQSKLVRENIYSTIFRKRLSIRLAPETQLRCHLHREFSIFLEDGRYVLLAAMGFSENPQPVAYYWKYPDMYEQLEIYSYSFFLVDLKLGKVSDILNYPHDCIVLSHNQGVSAYRNTLAVLSKYRQCITCYELCDGKLHKLYELGPYGDELRADSVVTLNTQLPLSHLKQRVLTCLYMEIWNEPDREQKQLKLKQFYKNFHTYEHMLLDKIQLINNDYMLLRYEERYTQMPNKRSYDERTDFKLYAFYSMHLDCVLRVYQKDSIELLSIYRNYCDIFRNVRYLQGQFVPASPSNTESVRNSFDNVINTYFRNQTEAALRFNITLPISTQRFSVSHYLNLQLFEYDDRLIASLERPLKSSREPIHFNDRDTNRVSFRVHLDQCNGENADLVAYIFHPYEPFIISIQKLATRYVVNFHIYNEHTIVKQ